MPYSTTKTKSGKYKLHYKTKNGKMHTIPGESDSKTMVKRRIGAIEASKHARESFDQAVNNLLKQLLF